MITVISELFDLFEKFTKWDLNLRVNYHIKMKNTRKREMNDTSKAI